MTPKQELLVKLCSKQTAPQTPPVGPVAPSKPRKMSRTEDILIGALLASRQGMPKPPPKSNI